MPKKGYKQTVEHKKKISEALERREPPSEETREKLRQRALERGQGKAIPNEESRRKMSIAHKGSKMPPRTEEWRRKMSAAKTGKKHSPESNLKRSQTLKGRQITEKHRENLSKALTGKYTGPLSPNYIDGRTKKVTGVYSGNFTSYLKKKVRARDKNICQSCFNETKGRSGCIHHINGDKKDSTMNNLILVCVSCHNKIHSYSEYHSDKIVEFRMKLKPENRPVRANG